MNTILALKTHFSGVICSFCFFICMHLGRFILGTSNVKFDGRNGPDDSIAACVTLNWIFYVPDVTSSRLRLMIISDLYVKAGI
jgi:hypothetical protein